ncbi:MAG: hypothetical protein OEY14_08100 [Myxococcales bacterium]|nr:hypothetical protein [Myxococcales bacterium]
MLSDGSKVTVAHRRVHGLDRTFGILVVEPGLELTAVFANLDAAMEPVEEVLVLQLGW